MAYGLRVGFKSNGETLRDASLKIATESLLVKLGLLSPFRFYPLPGGANNQLFRVDMQETQLCLKAYFQHPDDQRDRLGTEFAFVSFAWGKGVRAIPEPLGVDRDHGIALYEYIPGRKMTPGEIDKERIEEALHLYLSLNQHGSDPVAQTLPKASEACFSLGEHIDRVNFRVERLSAIRETTDMDREAVCFVRQQIVPAWQKLLRIFHGEAKRAVLSLERIISKSDRCLSPSDFGYHNAILSAGGKLRFVDFEYAGWDDPAKLVCDFFCQPEIPVPLKFFPVVSRAVAKGLVDQENHLKRMGLLLPVYHLKWCCILLNEFLPVGNQRRQYAFGSSRAGDRKRQQLEKAKQMLQRLEELETLNV
jgi:thiamine kinase-like enzyme